MALSDNRAIGVLYEQLPRAVREKVSVRVMPYEFQKQSIATFTGTDGRSWAFSVQDDGRIGDAALAHLCILF